jgi:carbamoyl-phosphate synthase small subunit
VTAFLALEDGTVFPGESVGSPGHALGEAVFTTAMTGYQEIVTDPSFAEQIVTFTAPMIGNYGVDPARCESGRAQARAVVMREARGPGWTDWLHERGIVALTGVDTRSLVLHLRERGSMRAIAVAGKSSVDEAVAAARSQPPMAGRALAAGVSTREPYVFEARGRSRVAVLDYGCKRSILARLSAAGAAVTVFPYDADPEQLLGFDGVLVSNGPGDPEPLELATLSFVLGKVPVLGICLGHQLLARAAGLKTYKLPFGHRGANHPVLDRRTERVLVTSQNHGFAVEPSEGSESTHVSLYDGTVEGLDLPDLGARSVQFHPEAGPGPHDARPIVEEWVEEVTRRAA